ncbi:PREDICTED: CD9 antigen-like [Branchiostoma belcheri]|uniref:Tetraspanin n=1 Tax=Branchiostoma belcheri TaxID=7741 RepID=A0A6P4YA09_BRABE|nr:PREDICTED: CD9 antigen-like [Branchiostoma belcheri]
MAEGTSSGSAIKTQLFVLNVVLWLAGGVLFAVGIWLLYDPEIAQVVSAELHLTWFYHACYAMVVAGAITILVACVGCYGAMKESKLIVIVFGVLLFIVFALNVGAVIVGVKYYREVRGYTRDSFQDAMPRGYIEDKDYRFKDDVKIIENKFSCCGLRDMNNHGVPCLQDSCLCDSNIRQDCKNYTTWGGTCQIYPEPCMYAVSSFLKNKITAMIALPLIVAFIQLCGICFVCTTQRKMGENVA